MAKVGRSSWQYRDESLCAQVTYRQVTMPLRCPLELGRLLPSIAFYRQRADYESSPTLVTCRDHFVTRRLRPSGVRESTHVSPQKSELHMPLDGICSSDRFSQLEQRMCFEWEVRS